MVETLHRRIVLPSADIANDRGDDARPTCRPAADFAREIATRGPITRLRTGIATLDEAMRGGLPVPRVTLLVGAPGAAKTSLALSLAHDFAKRGYAVGVLSVDEGVEGAIARFAQHQGIDARDLEAGNPDSWKAIVDHLASLRMIIADADEGATIESTAAELAALAKGEPAILVVDSIQTCSADGTASAASPRERIDAAVKAVKVATYKHRFISLVTSEMNRSAYRSNVGAELLNDLAASKESGSLEYAGRTILTLRNVPGADDLVDVSVTKNTGYRKVPFRLRIDFGRISFSEVAIPLAPPKGERVRVDHLDDDVTAVIKLLKDNPGIGGKFAVRAQLRVAGVHMSNARSDAAIAALRVAPDAALNGARIADRPNGRFPRWFFVDEGGTEQ